MKSAKQDSLHSRRNRCILASLAALSFLSYWQLCVASQAGRVYTDVGEPGGYRLIWEKSGEESACAAIGAALNTHAISTNCLSTSAAARCRWDVSASSTGPVALPEWRETSAMESAALPRVASNFLSPNPADQDREMQEWQWENQYGLYFRNAAQAGLLKTMKAEFDVDNDGTTETVWRLEIDATASNPLVVQFASKTDVPAYDRSIWRERGNWTPILVAGRTLWVGWSHSALADDPRYGSDSEKSYAYVALSRQGLTNLLHETVICSFHFGRKI